MNQPEDKTLTLQSYKATLLCCRYLRTLPYPATLLQATLTLRHNIIPNIAPPEVSRDQPISWAAPLLAPELWPPPAQVMITSDFLHLGTNKLSPTPRGNTAYPHQPLPQIISLLLSVKSKIPSKHCFLYFAIGRGPVSPPLPLPAYLSVVLIQESTSSPLLYPRQVPLVSRILHISGWEQCLLNCFARIVISRKP